VATSASAQTSIADARSSGDGTTVTVEGTVTRALGDFLRLQDASGPTGASALVVRQTSGALHDDIADGTIARGTQLRVTGTLSSFNALLQINEDDISSYDVLGTGPVPDPQDVTLSELSTNGEEYESELVSVTGLSLQGASGSFEADETYQVVASATGTEFDFRVQSSDESELGDTAIPDGAFDYTGVVGQFDPQGSTSTGYQLIPVRTSDLSPSRSFSFGRPYALAEEGSGLASVGVQAFNLPSDESASVTVQVAATSTASPSADVAGFSGTQTLTFTGPSPSPQMLSFDVLADGASEGVERLEVTLTSSDGVTAAPDRFTLWILDDPVAQGPIAEGLEAGALLDALASTYGNVPTLGYSIARDTMFAVVYGARGDSLRGAYTGFAKFLPADADPTVAACNFDTGDCTDPDDINTEHAWPQSRGSGQEPARSNMHILFPTRADVNSARFTFPYGDVPDAEADEWFIRDATRSMPPATNRDAWSRVDNGASRFEPRDAVKGDIARAMFYFAAIYPDRANESFFEPQKATLFQWHQDDPVDAAEARRNVLQAAYQGNKLNPFVVDSTLIRRAFGALTPPRGLSATAGETSIQLDWSAPRSGFIDGYNVYRATAPFDAPGAAERLNADPLTTTTFTDAEVTVGVQYVYRVSTVDVGGAESDLSDPVEGVSYPNTVEVSFTRAFGSVDEAENYRLVALPGEVDRSLAATVAGEPGDAWQAFWDDGSDTNFLRAYTNSDRFDFRPGRGFWLLSSTNWTVAETFSTVSLADGTTTIPLHNGWNIISNPFDVDVAWSAVEGANGGSLQPIWAWGSTVFDEAATFASARQGEAFYFLNDSGLDALTIPYDPASAAAGDAQQAAASTTLQLMAHGGEQDVSRVRLGTAPGSSAGRDVHDVVAPPMAFQSTALYALPVGADTASSPRRARLAHDMRSSSVSNHTFDLILRATPGAAIALRLGDSEAFAGANVVLVDLAAGTAHDLRATPTVSMRPTHEETALRVLVGDDAFVNAEQENLLPETLRLHPNYPNPFRTATTLTYDLPNASAVRIAVYDVLGRRVQVLVDERKEAGRHTVRWDGRGQSEQSLASGIYFVRLRAGDRQLTRRLTLVR
jgi:endonuclease I